MKIIACIDNNNGILFNHRRLSKDKEVTSDILSMIAESCLVCSEYSSTLFSDSRIIITDDKMNIPKNGYYFIENIFPNDFEKSDEIILYKWNREYPSDTKFEVDMKKYVEVSETEFLGYSHEKITKIVLKRSC